MNRLKNDARHLVFVIINKALGENISHGVSLSAIRGAAGSTGEASAPIGDFGGLSLGSGPSGGLNSSSGSIMGSGTITGSGMNDSKKGLSLEQKQAELKRRENEEKMKSQPQLFKQA